MTHSKLKQKKKRHPVFLLPSDLSFNSGFIISICVKQGFLLLQFCGHSRQAAPTQAQRQQDPHCWLGKMARWLWLHLVFSLLLVMLINTPCEFISSGNVAYNTNMSYFILLLGCSPWQRHPGSVLQRPQRSLHLAAPLWRRKLLPWQWVTSWGGWRPCQIETQCGNMISELGMWQIHCTSLTEWCWHMNEM